MKRLMIAGLILLQACSSSISLKHTLETSAPEGISIAVAHRGCWLRENDGEYYIPENSPHGIRMARRYGYPAVEIDVKYTLDQKMVCMHDGTVNRTMRNAADYSRIEEAVRVSDCLFEDLRRDYVLESSDPAMRTPIPTLEEMLLCCRKEGIVPMLHSKVLESYELAQKLLGDNWIAFDSNYSAMRFARKVSDCLILWDPGRLSAEETISALDEIGGWCGMSTMKYEMQDSAYIAALQQAGKMVQSSIFPTPHEQRSLHDGADIELSDFFWHQTIGRERVSGVDVNLELEEGECWQSPSFEASDFAAMTVHLNLSGSVLLRVWNHCKTADGWALAPREYPLHRDKPGEEVVGLRLYKTAPRIEIVALEASSVSVKADIYEL